MFLIKTYIDYNIVKQLLIIIQLSQKNVNFLNALLINLNKI